MNRLAGQTEAQGRSRFSRKLFSTTYAATMGLLIWGDSIADSTSAESRMIPEAGPTDEQPMLTFDYLGGGPMYIEVYPGVSETDEDRIGNGVYLHGESRPALCYLLGRTVESNTDLGERDRISNVWFEIIGPPGDDRHFATAVYSVEPLDLMSRLSECKLMGHPELPDELDFRENSRK
jgi:hypothetical protein